MWREPTTPSCGPAKTIAGGGAYPPRCNNTPPRRRVSDSPRRRLIAPPSLLLPPLLLVAVVVLSSRPPPTITGAATAAAATTTAAEAFSSVRPTFALRTTNGRGFRRRTIMPPNNVVPVVAPPVMVPKNLPTGPTAASTTSTSTALLLGGTGGAGTDDVTKTAVPAPSSPPPTTAAVPSTSLSPSVRPLFDRARALFESSTFGDTGGGGSVELVASHAPGRVNLIGEHVDYTGGYVFPMAINVGTACYGRGSIVPVVPSSSSSDASEGGPPTPSVSCRLASDMFPDHKLVSITTQTAGELTPFDHDSPDRWANYVLGVVREYLPDVPDGHTLEFDMAVAGNVPLGGGLSSSASLEVAVATFLEAVLGEEHAYSSSQNRNNPTTVGEKGIKIRRALRAQRAEREFAGTPCGIMDQFVSSAAEPGCVLLIDCRAVDYEGYRMGTGAAGGGGEDDDVRVVICNSMVKHDNAGGEYPIRVEQCRVATDALRNFHPEITSLRDATLSDVEEARESMDDVTFRRARHVVTENDRTVRAARAWRDGDFNTVGRLMDESHVSMRDDYETSCDEIDVLVELAQTYPGGGVYGSRLTGGGFGGCTVTLVKSSEVDGLMRHLRRGYRERFPDLLAGNDCECFETGPEDGARVIEV